MSDAPTEDQFDFAGILGYACTIPGTCLCFLVLVAYAVVGLSPKGRAQMDRVSFRLIVYSLFLNILYGIAFSVTASQTGPGSLCTFGAWAVNFTLTLTIYFTTCIALNLLLVLVYRVNGRKMEKYYVIGTFVIAIVLTVPAYGLHQFGWSESSSTCWFRNADGHGLRWLIGTQAFWMLFAATVETICSVMVLVWLFRNQMYVHQIRSTTDSTTKSNHRLWGGNADTSAMIHQANRYRHIIYRISLYPIVSLIINVITTALDLDTTIKGVPTQAQFRLLVLDLILYGLRTFIYAILAAADPSFWNAIRAMRGKPLPAPSRDQTELHSMPQAQAQDPVDHNSVNSSIRKRTHAQDEEEVEEDWEFQRQL
ncbi:hypothetical protein K435DRAFT_854839 [Dendrothele bispora CBS 962.96]|uniref:G-protein coupled receptors family 2 profile 2 domain-containing protein n=1 Tax=Dendrothele bispora (strain CBS 962.96) TaxID=1314807 RepID=A0A4S8ME98_DENBC|nr:hypothetical protein K435DRAFT_854839 [Dendrothele bispora CBS 962.96]